MMADSSLDEFFAKKDRSKKAKNKAKFTTSELARKLEDPSPAKKAEKTLRKDKEKSVSTSSGSRIQSLSHQNEDQGGEDEWKDFEEEKEKDYSGLRIQALSVSDREKEDEQYKDQQPQQNGENSKSDVPSGPWKVIATPQTPPASPEPEKSEEAAKLPGGGAYRPPQMRESSSSNLKRNRKTAPELGDELHFPSLSVSLSASSKGQKLSETYSERSFQTVKHGMKSKDDVSVAKQTLDLENKFSALHQGD